VALLHNAELTPSKLEAITAWVPGRPWVAGLDLSTLTAAGAYRFDDPDGEVGIETILVRTADGALLQVPLTYRGAPLAGAEDALVCTMEHSVLGSRWIYDGCADPVGVRALATAVLTGGHEAELDYDSGRGIERREPTVRVTGSGTPGPAVPAIDAVTSVDGPLWTVVAAGELTVSVRRRLDRAADADPAGGTLRGTWSGQDEPVVLATVR
jgi:Maltokinase N-terminal cap domain